MEARGNSPSYPAQGVNFVRSTLTWGPLPSLASRLFGWQSLKRSTYAQRFHTYTLEWTENFIKIYVDSRLKNMVQLQIDGKQQSNGGFFWKRGNFPLTAHNNTANEIVVPNPWTTATVANATNAAPFDQRASFHSWCTDKAADFVNLLFVQRSIWFSISLPADRVAGSQTGWATSLGSMSQLLRCGTLPASRVLGVQPGQTMMMTYHLECMCLLTLLFFWLTDSVVTRYACGTSVELWLYAWTMDRIIWPCSYETWTLRTDRYPFFSFLLLTCPLLVHAHLHFSVFTTLLSKAACPRIISSCIVNLSLVVCRTLA